MSYVVNGGPRKVAPATAERVTAAIAALNYRPNAVARSLRRMRTGVIGVVMPDIANPFFAELASAIEDSAASLGDVLLVGNSERSTAREARNVRTFVEYRVDGLVLVPVAASVAESVVGALSATAAVVLDRALDGFTWPTFLPDNRGGARAATGHLLEHGHRSIGCIAGPESLASARERLAGWRDAVTAAGLSSEQTPCTRSAFDRDAGQRAAYVILSGEQPRPRALFVSSDEQAFGVLSAAAGLGLRVPADLALVSFDGVRHTRSAVPPLTTVRQPFERFGQAAVEAITRRPAARPGQGGRIERFPVALQIGGSCGCQNYSPVAPSTRTVAERH